MMYGDRRERAELLISEKLCLQCKEIRPLNAFPRQKGKRDVYKKICNECELLKQNERRRRVVLQRETWQQQQDIREETRQKAWVKKVTFRLVQEERWCERERWYLHQPDRRCRMCSQVLPALAFGCAVSPGGFLLHTRCRACHKALLEQQMLSCCLCQQKIPRTDFLAYFNGYALSGCGTSISLCCKTCETAFLTLSDLQQRQLISSCCQRTFPNSQVIYAEVDPETGEIRYIGRSGRPKRRHAQHLQDAVPVADQWKWKKNVWYSRRNWIQALSDKGLQPSMQILQTVEHAPLVIEWEQRYIWYGLQQGWKLLNVEARDEAFVARIKASRLDFLRVPFDVLVQQHFFSPHGFTAFLHIWS